MNNNDKRHPLAEILPELLKDRRALIELARRDFLSFTYIHSDTYLEYAMADYHRELFAIGQDPNLRRAVIIGFRGSAKSTINNTNLAQWFILGVPQGKFIVIVSQTQQQARRHLKNIRDAVERNELLKEHFGPFRYEEGKESWNASTLEFTRYGARIIAVSMEESVRGLRAGPHRPDLIILDDIEDLNSARTHDRRNKTYQWITGEIFPLGGPKTKVVILGNFVHEDSAVMRLYRQIDEGKMPGTCLWIPLIDQDGHIAWPDKYPDDQAIEILRQEAGSESAFQRDYLLKHHPGDEQILRDKDIAYYDRLPQPVRNEFGDLVNGRRGPRRHGVDLAVSERETADKCARVSGQLFKVDGVNVLFIDPWPLNERLTFPELLDHVNTFKGDKFYVEDVAFQKAALQVMSQHGLNVIGMSPSGRERYARFQAAAAYIKSGRVRFPKKGCEHLILQLLYFGYERHDDLLDALVYLILGLAEEGMFNGGFTATTLTSPTHRPSMADYHMTGEDLMVRFAAINNPDGSFDGGWGNDTWEL